MAPPTQSTRLNPSATFKSKGGRKGPQTPNVEKELPGMHVKSAKMLRKEYVELQEAPDGMDPDPLTLPKVVECGHCGWPVYPRDSKVATKKTFARAGIIRGTRKEEEAKRAEEGGSEDSEEDEGSEDSRNTEEQLRDELEDLQDKCEDLEKENEDLKEENEEMKTEIKDLKAVVEEQLERIEFMEEMEQRWRDKLYQAELRKEELTLFLERSSLVAADRERGLVVALQEIQTLREKLATFQRRRVLMLLVLEQKLKKKDEEDYLAITFRLWRTFGVKTKLSRESEELETARQRDVSNLQLQVQMEKSRVAALKATETQLRGRLRAAGQRLLARALSSEMQPAFKAHALRVWEGTTPALALENELERTRRELEKAKKELEELRERNVFLEAELLKVSAERDQLAGENLDLKDQIEFLKLEGGGPTKSRDLEGKRQDRNKAIQQQKEALEQALASLEKERRERKQEKEELEQEIEALEGRLEAAEAAAAAGSGKGVPEVDEASRICPKGQGVLCVGCLKQLVHRGVRPLPPVKKLPAGAADHLEKMKEKFFEQELKGAPAVDDELHTFAWKARKDPYGIARLTVWPRSKASKGSPGGSSSRPSSPTGSELGSTTPKTGLPALKKTQKLRAEGVVSPLRMTMRDFKPVGFR